MGKRVRIRVMDGLNLLPWICGFIMAAGVGLAVLRRASAEDDTKTSIQRVDEIPSLGNETAAADIPVVMTVAAPDDEELAIDVGATASPKDTVVSAQPIKVCFQGRRHRTVAHRALRTDSLARSNLM